MSRAITVGTPLTFREFQVARLVGCAFNIRDIMGELKITDATVKSRMRQIMKKTGARTVPQLVCWMNCELFLAGLMVMPKQ